MLTVAALHLRLSTGALPPLRRQTFTITSKKAVLDMHKDNKHADKAVTDLFDSYGDAR